MSQKLAPAFGFGVSGDKNVLDHFVDLYFDHFAPLWPLLSFQNLEYGLLHPLLYLVLSSIGAMYGTAADSVYGRKIHEAIRKPLMVALDFEDSNDDFLWLGQARLLTQVAALYFGQSKAFSCAQQLGALTIAQARRMDLFTCPTRTRGFGASLEPRDSQVDSDLLTGWLHIEARRRLAFGIFRADTYTSVLLGTNPLLSPDEVNLGLPSCDIVWRGKRMLPEVCLQLIDQSRPLGRPMRFSDIYRVAMDRKEHLPPLEPTSYELLMFALQKPVWKFSNDPDMFERLTGEEYCNLPMEPINELLPRHGYAPRGESSVMAGASYHTGSRRTTLSDHLHNTERQMADLKDEYKQVFLALEKWKSSLTFVKTLVQTQGDRTSLLSSLLLYNLSYLRLYAPVSDLHRLQYQLVEGFRPLNNRNKSPLQTVCRWVKTPRARLAAEYAGQIWELITNESKIPEEKRAKFNLIAFTALHHTATVLWAYASAHDHSSPLDSPLAEGGDDEDVAEHRRLELRSADPDAPRIRVCRSQSKAVLKSLVRLYAIISPGRWSSFAQAAADLSKHQLPPISAP